MAQVHEVLSLNLRVDLQTGLTQQQVVENRASHGANKLPEDKPRPFIVYLAMEFLQPLILILLFLLGLTLYNLASNVQKGQRVPLDVWVKLVIIVLVVSLVTTFNALGNSATGKALGELASLAGQKSSRVRRSGCEEEVAAEELVVGDVVLVRSGDVVQADIRIVEANDLACVEAALTGEPTECRKSTRPLDPSAPFLSSMLYSGTSVVCGSGFGVVTAVGPATEIGQIAQKLDKVEALETPVQKTMRRLGAMLIVLVVIMLGVFAFFIARWEQYDVTKYDNNRTLAVLFEALSLAQILLPTTLMLAVTVNLRKGVLLLRKHNAMLRRFTAVETLGCTTVICSDKTGTLTEGKMTVVSAVTVTAAAAKGRADKGSFGFHPTRGFDPRGGLYTAAHVEQLRKRDGLQELVSGKNAGLNAEDLYPPPQFANLGDQATAEGGNPLPRALVGAAFLNCSEDTRIEGHPDGSWGCVGNSSEAALVVAAAKVGMWRPGTVGLGDPQEDVLRVHAAEDKLEVPFSSARKMKLTVHAAASGSLLGVGLPSGTRHVAIVKGAPDRVLPLCKRVFSSDCTALAQLDEAARQALSSANLSLAGTGLRVLAVALLPMTDEQVELLRGQESAEERLQWVKEQDLTVLGLLGLEDPPREGVKEAVAACHAAGVRVVMITGDQAATAASIARKVGIVRPGEDAGALSYECGVLHEDPADPTESKHRAAAEIDVLTRGTLVWARAQPVDKIAIVESLQRQGNIAAMTGDGVNDAAALKAADIGTAMGIAGTEVAKAASDMILLDDNFSTIVDAVREGRHIYGNLQKYIYYYLGMKLSELVMFSVCVFFMLPKPVGGIRALLGKNITHDTTPLTLTAEEAEPYQMRVPPRPREEFIITPQLFSFRMLPQLFWFSIVLLGGGAIMSNELLGSTAPKRATSKVGDWVAEGPGNCLKASVCAESGGKLGCKGQADPFVCRSRLGGAWHYEHAPAAARDISPGDWGDFKGGLLGDKATWLDADNSARTWNSPSLGTFSYQDNQSGQSFVAVRPCSPKTAAGWGDLFTSELGPSTQACWTQEALAHFGGRPPTIPSDVNRVDWAFRQLQGTQFLMFVLLEYTILMACRTEEFAWRAHHNPWFPKVSGLGLLVTLLLIYTPGLRRGCEMAPVGVLGWALALGGALTALVCTEATKALYRWNLAKRQIAATSANPYMNPVKTSPV